MRAIVLCGGEPPELIDALRKTMPRSAIPHGEERGRPDPLAEGLTPKVIIPARCERRVSAIAWEQPSDSFVRRASRKSLLMHLPVRTETPRHAPIGILRQLRRAEPLA